MSQGFGKVTSPKKSVSQKVRLIFRSIHKTTNRRGNQKHGSIIHQPIALIEQIEDKSQDKEDVKSAPVVTLEVDTRPNHIDLKHWDELVNGSKIDPEIASLNFKSLGGMNQFDIESAYDVLLYKIPKKNRNGQGRPQPWILDRYKYLDDSGWYGAGVDVIKGGDSEWGCFKPNNPPYDEKRNRPRKYINPEKTPTEIFALRIPPKIWRKIADRYSVALPENYENLPHHCFWEWVREHKEIPIILTEGAKKAACILSCGYVIIALPGVNGAFRYPRDEDNTKTGEPVKLIPQIEIFTQPGRRVYFCFDQDVKRNTIRNVNRDLGKTARLITRKGCEVKVMQWTPALGKGVDDVVATTDRDYFDALYRDAISLEEWDMKQMKRLTYPVDISINRPKIGDINLPPEEQYRDINIPPEAQFICVKAPKGTGKTHFLEWFTDAVVRSGERKLLAIFHRVQLGTQAAKRLGIPFVTELAKSEQGDNFGMALCVDSLHQHSQARFHPDEWKGCWIILDEVMQFIWHLLSSSTCQSDVVKIVKNLKQVLLNCINHGGKIILLDADLNDIAIDFINGLCGNQLTPFIIENNFVFKEPWNVYVFGEKDPSKMIAHLVDKLKKGEKHYLNLSAQKEKSRWSSTTLEKLFTKISKKCLESIPDLKILRIDSKTVSNPKHPAFGCVEKLDEIIKDYDLVVATQTLETGVSIDLVGHFAGVWGIYQGVSTTDSVRQGLSRVREPVPRYIWAESRGINFVGNSSTNYLALMASENKKDKIHKSLLLQCGFEENLEGFVDNTAFTTWAKLGAIINAGMFNYRKQIIDDLASEGHIIIPLQDNSYVLNGEENILPSDAEAEEMKKAVIETRDENYKEHNEKVAAIDSPTDDEYQELKSKQSKTDEEHLKHRKGSLERLYMIPVTAELVKKDDDRWHSEINLHYYLDKGNEFLPDREKAVMEQILKSGEGDLFCPASNKKMIGAKIAMLFTLKIKELLIADAIHNEHPLVVDVCGLIKEYSYDIKDILGIDFSKERYGVSMCQRLVGLIGYRFPFIGKRGAKGHQVRMYGKAAANFEMETNDKGKEQIKLVNGQAIALPDGRDEVLVAWIERDLKAREKAAEDKLKAEKLAEQLRIEKEQALEQEKIAKAEQQREYVESKKESYKNALLRCATPEEAYLKWHHPNATKELNDAAWELMNDEEREYFGKLYHSYSKQLQAA